MIQRKKKSSLWEVTGKIARLAADGFFITNATKEILAVDEAINRSLLNERPADEILAEMDKVARLTGNHLGKYYPKFRMMAIDIGMDAQQKIWIIEVNLNPSIYLFKRLADKTMFETIKRYLRE